MNFIEATPPPVRCELSTMDDHSSIYRSIYFLRVSILPDVFPFITETDYLKNEDYPLTIRLIMDYKTAQTPYGSLTLFISSHLGEYPGQVQPGGCAPPQQALPGRWHPSSLAGGHPPSPGTPSMEYLKSRGR